MFPDPHLDDIEKPITSASPEIRTIIERILKLEKTRLSQPKPRHINEDILRIIKELIK